MKKKSLLTGIMTLLIVFGIVNINTKLVYAYTNATGMYVNPVNEKKADIMTVDWSTTKNAPNTYWAVHNWNAGGEKLVDMLAFNKELINVHFTLQSGTQSL